MEKEADLNVVGNDPETYRNPVMTRKELQRKELMNSDMKEHDGMMGRSTAV